MSSRLPGMNTPGTPLRLGNRGGRVEIGAGDPAPLAVTEGGDVLFNGSPFSLDLEMIYMLSLFRFFEEYYALMAPDNPSPIPAGDPVMFPRDGAHGVIGSLIARGEAPGTFVVSDIGVAVIFRVSWRVTVSDASQLGLYVNGELEPSSVVGLAQGGESVGDVTLPLAPGDVLSLRVVEGSRAVELTEAAGSLVDAPASALLRIELVSLIETPGAKMFAAKALAAQRKN